MARAAPRRGRRLFAKLYRDHFNLVWSAVRHLGVGDAERDDVVQEVWLRAYRRLETLDPEASAKAWLCAIARHVVLHHHRTRYRRGRKLASLAAQPSRHSEDPQRRHDARSTLAAILDGLGEEQRQVLVLATVHGLSGPEIASGLGIPLNTTYSRLRLARRHVAELAANDDELARAEQPPQQAANRGWALLLPQIGWPGVAATAAAPWAGFKIVVSAAVLATAALGAIAVVAPMIRGTPDVPVADASPTLVPSPAAIATPSTIAEPAVQAEPISLPAAPTVRVASAMPSPAASAPVTRKASAPRAVAAPAPPETPPVAAARTDAPSAQVTQVQLREETRMVMDAQRALTQGDAAAALRSLQAHRQQFPTGQLAQTREGVWVRALCRAGRKTQARAHASTVMQRYPGTPLAEAVRDVCKESPVTMTEPTKPGNEVDR